MESSRLVYRKFELDDIDDLNEILTNPNVCKYLPGEGAYSKEIVEKWLTYFIRSYQDERNTHHYAILEKGKDKVIGYGGIGYVKEFDQMEIMYGLSESVWGKGYGTECSLRFKELAKELGMKHVIALADIHNIGSQKILLKTGYTQIKQIQIWGLDCYYYEMEL